MTVGERIRERRIRVGLRQGVLANTIGCAQETICNIEKGRRHPSTHMLYAIAAALGCRPSDLLDNATEADRCGYVRLPAAAWEQVDRLLATGLHGATLDEVVTGLALAELRRIVGGAS